MLKQYKWPIDQGIVPSEACIIVLLPGMHNWLSKLLWNLLYYFACQLWLMVGKFVVCSKRVLGTTSDSQSFSLHFVTQSKCLHEWILGWLLPQLQAIYTSHLEVYSYYFFVLWTDIWYSFIALYVSYYSHTRQKLKSSEPKWTNPQCH